MQYKIFDTCIKFLIRYQTFREILRWVSKLEYVAPNLHLLEANAM